MKRRFSKILGVGLTLALLASLLMTAAPVSALSVPSVVPSSTTISKTTSYAVTFNLGKELTSAATLKVKGAATIEWSTAQVNPGDSTYSALLKTTGIFGSGDEARIVIPMPAGTTLDDIDSIAWYLYNVKGYIPHVDFVLDKDGDGTRDDVLVAEGAHQNNDAWFGSAYISFKQTFEGASGFYTPWANWISGSCSDLTSVNNETAVWLNSLGTAASLDLLSKYKAGTAYGAGATVDADTAVLALEIEVDNWIPAAGNSEAYVDDVVVVIDGITKTYALEPPTHTITITFPPTTGVPLDTNIAGATLVASPGWIGGVWKNATTTGVTFAGDDTTRTVKATLGVNDEIGEGATVRIQVPGITNPPAIGSYNLTVKTSKETTAVTSAAYAITSPTILPLPGVVERYNTAGVLMAQTNKIQVAIDAASAGDSIIVGPGTYDEAITINESLTITGDAATTIIKDVTGGTVGGTVTITYVPTASTVAGVVFDGFTVMGRPGVTALKIIGEKVTVQNCIFTKAGTATTTSGQTMAHYVPFAALPDFASTITNNTFDTTLGVAQDTGVLVDSAGLTVSNNTFTVDGAIDAEDSAVTTSGVGTTSLPIKISGNTITGGSGIGVTFTAGKATASDNTLTGLNAAFNIGVATATIKGNTIDNCGLAINTTTALVGQAAIIVGAPTALSITNNTITNSPNDIIEIVDNSENINMMFNNLIGNAKGIDNNDNDKNMTLNATHNWWGEVTGPATGFNVTLGAVNDTTAYLGGEATGSFALDSASLITKKTVGVDVTATGTKPAIVGVANYTANPQDATPLPAIAGGFYDVYLAEAIAGAPDSVLIKFYNANITANTKIYVWGTIAGGWQAVDTPAGAQGVNLFEGFAFATITSTTTPSIAALAGTPFALVGAPLAAIDAPELMSPDPGERDIPLTPTFSWTQIAAAAGYYFELADNANFVLPLVKLDGDLGRLIVTAYAYVPGLDYSSAYYWRVKAVKGTEEAGNLAESAWVYGVFITMDEPEEPTPPIEIVEAPTLPDITITQPDITIQPPDIIVPLPAETPITPAWIYVIIGVGAVLVIALIVLIVRTRRVA